MKHLTSITRRAALFGVSLAAFAGQASAQSATSRALEDFGRYLDAAADLFGEFALGIRSADAATLRQPQTRASLERIANALLDLYGAQSVLIGDLEDYARAARRREGAQEVWNGILYQVRRTGRIVQQVIGVVESTPALNVALTPEQNMILRETLAARGAILSRFENLPRPRTRAEIAQLEGMNARYRRLIQTLREIRLVLDQVLERGPEPRP
jgi:hypothetical protein